METDNSAVKAWEGGRSRVEGVNGVGERNICNTFINKEKHFLKLWKRKVESWGSEIKCLGPDVIPVTSTSLLCPELITKEWAHIILCVPGSAESCTWWMLVMPTTIPQLAKTQPQAAHLPASALYHCFTTLFLFPLPPVPRGMVDTSSCERASS